jgi:hypothetical protein
MKVNWINTKDKMPDEDDLVWCMDRYKNKKGELRQSMHMAVYEELTCAAHCDKNHEEFGFLNQQSHIVDCSGMLKNVTHWAMLDYPESPLIIDNE